MVIDLILDRKDERENGIQNYKAKTFYNNVFEYRKVFPEISDKITLVMDYGSEIDVKNALCDYVKQQEYNPKTCDFISSVDWLADDDEEE